jgi:hypothetical protein
MLRAIQNRRYWLVLVVQSFLFFISPFTREHPFVLFLFIFGLFGIFGSVILTIWRARLPRLLALVSALMALGTGYMAFPSMRFDAPVIIYLTACCISFSLFILIAIVSIGADVLLRKRATLDCILGSICVYMFLGMLFAFIFGLLVIFMPDAFDNEAVGMIPGKLRLNDLLYFSYSTLTTTGYGDITPLHPFVRTVAAFEGIVGTLYLVVMISRLIGLHVAETGSSEA